MLKLQIGLQRAHGKLHVPKGMLVQLLSCTTHSGSHRNLLGRGSGAGVSEKWHLQCHLTSGFLGALTIRMKWCSYPTGKAQSRISGVAVSCSCSLCSLRDALECSGSWQHKVCVRASRAHLRSWVSHWASHGIPEVGKALCDAKMPAG